jgi:ppGpp synthetase/RelA/SpoT-type nucleotidyltranferase
MRLLLCILFFVQTSFAREYIEPALIPTVDTYELICEKSGIKPVVSPENVQNMCKVVVASEYCEKVPIQDRIDCDNLKNYYYEDKLEFFMGCTKGAFKSGKDFLNFVWRALKAITVDAGDTWSDAKDYYSISKLYLYTEYEKAYANTSGDNRFWKALYEMDENFSRGVISTVVDFIETMIKEKYPSYGCYNYEAKSEMVCHLTGNIVIPPAAFFAALKFGPKAYAKFGKFLGQLKVARQLEAPAIAVKLAGDYAKVSELITKKWTTLFSDLGAVKGRVKSADSLTSKLQDRFIKTYDDAKALISDGVANRVVFKASEAGVVDPQTIQKFVDRLSEEIKKGFRIIEIENYRGPNGVAYLSDLQINQLLRADAVYKEKLYKLRSLGKQVEIPAPMKIKNGGKAIKESGYASTHFTVDDGWGLLSELQIRGPLVHEISRAEHLFYDLKKGKAIGAKYANNDAVKAIVKDYGKLSRAQKKAMDDYIRERFNFARQAELGRVNPANAPPLPKSLPSSLSFENVLKEMN